ncbi:ABC transporter permease [Staphylococcus pseudintermedius]
MRWYGKFYLIAMLVVLYLPIFFLMLYSFNSAGNMVQFEGFTWEHYQTLFDNKRLLQVVFNTIAVALLAAGIATIIGIFGALLLYQLRNQTVKISLLTLNNVLMVSSDVVDRCVIFNYVYCTRTFYRIWIRFYVCSHLTYQRFCIPIVVIIVLPKLYEMNDSIMNAARDLGASEFQLLSKVVIPYIMPGIIGGFFMALTYSLDDFTVSFFVTGNGFSVLSVEVYSMARRGISMEINAISTILFALIMLGLLIYQVIQRQKQKIQSNKRGVSL